MTFGERLADSLSGRGRFTAKRLLELCDPSASDVRAAASVWAESTPRRRVRLLTALAAAAREDVSYNFKQLFLFALDDPDAAVRRAAVDGLWEAQGSLVLSRLVAALATDPDAGVRAASARALDGYAYAAAVGDLNQSDSDELLTALQQALGGCAAGDPTRAAVVGALAYFGSGRVADEIEQLYSGPPAEQVTALSAMGRSMDERWTEAVLAATGSPEPQVRSAAVHAAGELGLEQSVPALARLLYDPDAAVRTESIWALGQIASEKALRALRSFAADAPEDVQADVDAALNEALYSGDFD